jgi:hypothetical protein
MMGWIHDLWHNMTPGQGTLVGGAFVILAGIIAFGTGALDRRSQHKRFHYEEMKTLYAEALRVGRDLEVLKALPPEIRRGVLTEKADAIDRVISELALTGNYRTADLAIAYAYQQSVQLAEWVRQNETNEGATGRIQLWLDNLPEGQRERQRQSPRRGTGRAQGVGLVCAGGVTLPARAAAGTQTWGVSPELT